MSGKREPWITFLDYFLFSKKNFNSRFTFEISRQLPCQMFGLNNKATSLQEQQVWWWVVSCLFDFSLRFEVDLNFVVFSKNVTYDSVPLKCIHVISGFIICEMPVICCACNNIVFVVSRKTNRNPITFVLSFVFLTQDYFIKKTINRHCQWTAGDGIRTADYNRESRIVKLKS